MPEGNIKGRENSWYSIVAKFLVKTCPGDQRLLWDILFTLLHSGDLTVKLNLESGGGVSNWLTGICHRETSSLDREDTQERKGGDLSLAFLFLVLR